MAHTIITEYSKCPMCGGEHQVRCKCPLSDMKCANGHEWHHCPKCGVRISGPADHAKSTDAHLCNRCAGPTRTPENIAATLAILLIDELGVPDWQQPLVREWCLDAVQRAAQVTRQAIIDRLSEVNS